MSLVNVRISGQAEEALTTLTADGTSVSDAVRRALIDSARLQRRHQLRAEALRSMEDPGDRAKVQQVWDEWSDVHQG